MSVIALRSITSELSHLFMTIALVQQHPILIIPYLVHVYRYITYWDTVLEIQTHQYRISLILLTIIDWFIIYLVTFKIITRLEYIILLGTISGIISYYFVYDAMKRVKMPTTTYDYNILLDMTMVIILLLLLQNDSTNPRVVFFVTSDLVYHLLEQLFPHSNPKQELD